MQPSQTDVLYSIMASAAMDACNTDQIVIERHDEGGWIAKAVHTDYSDRLVATATARTPEGAVEALITTLDTMSSSSGAGS